MANASTPADTAAETGAAPPGASTADRYPGTPRWVKMSVIVVLALALVLVIAAVATGGQHGPMRHMPAGAPSGEAMART